MMDDLDPAYTQACSAKTVQSDSQGFFAEFFQEVRITSGEKWLQNKFKNLKTDHERVMSLFNDPQVCDPVLGVLEHVRPVFKEKDATFSSQRRIQGEKCFLVGDNKKALALLNQAVVRAPATGVDKLTDCGYTLAMALWTRSSVLLSEKDGNRALQDLKLATKNGFDVKQNTEYFWRTTKAYALMGDAIKTKISLGVLEKLVEGESYKIEKYRQELADIIPSTNKTENCAVPSLAGGENSNLKSASNLVNLVESLDKGRYIAAKDNVRAGDVVLVEDPVAACLLPTFFGSHCIHCFDRLVTPVPCPKCSGIAFCSDECMTKACNSYHKYECQFLDLLIGSGMSILCFIALRIFTQSNDVNAALSIANDLISNLCNNKELRQPVDYLHRTLMAAFLLRCLQKTEYFGIRKTEAVTPIDKEIEVGTALLGLLQVLQFNAHEIYATRITEDHKFDKSKIIYIGAGIYKTGSYFNHDCCPGVARFFVGKSIVLVCTRPVKSGESVSENYGPIATKKSLKERQKALRSRYWFKCTCDACRENWPTLEKLDKYARFRCPTATCRNTLKIGKDIGKDVRCAECRKNVSLKDNVASLIKCEELYREAAVLMKEEKTEEAIDAFKEGIELFHEVAVLPHKDTLIAQEALRTCFADRGSKFVQ